MSWFYLKKYNFIGLQYNFHVILNSAEAENSYIKGIAHFQAPKYAFDKWKFLDDASLRRVLMVEASD